MEYLVLELSISEDSQRLLEYVVAVLVWSQTLNNVVHTGHLVARLVAQLTLEVLVIYKVSTLENLLDLRGGLRTFKILLDHI